MGSLPGTLVATCSRGLEEVVQAELLALGHSATRATRGAVEFSGGLEALYRANLWLRGATRVLVRLASGVVSSREDLYRLAAEVSWEEVVAPGQTMAVAVAGRHPAFANTSVAALVVKDALVDRLRRVRGQRPDVDRRDPAVRVQLHLAPGEVTLHLDASGEPLSHRGYRRHGGPAPLSEALAAGALLLAGYDGTAPFLDPMCGSGTIAIEAALIATGTAPGLQRGFAFQRWWFHDPVLWAGLVERARASSRRAPAPIHASDVDEAAVRATGRHARRAGVGEWIEVQRRDARQFSLPGPGTVILTNPPYGERLGERDRLRPFYRELGDALKTRAVGATAWLLVGDRELAKEVGLRASRRIPLFNGPIECRLLRFDLFAGPAPRRGGGGGCP
jgi:putative N6-adenine-specific DNA methylase